MDVGRMLAIDPDDLDATDTADHALNALHQSRIRDVTIVARRGAESASFTSPELRELPGLESTNVQIERTDIAIALERAGTEPEKHVKSNLDAMMAIAESPTRNVERTLRFLFEHKPVEIKGQDRVSSIIFDTPSGRLEVPCDLVITAIGYKPSGLPGLVIEGNGYANNEGLVSGNIFVVGWAKRGPSGVIGTNKSDSTEVIHRLVESLGVPKNEADMLPLLRERGVKVIEQSGWMKINESELSQGVLQGRPRVKVTDVDEMLEIAQSNQ
jgi:ferredoxin--NADP+ reductase